MTPDAETNNLTPLQRALFAVKDMRSRLEAVERARTEPIAVIGAGCRFPGGVVDLESFWQLLNEGRDAITEVPPDRWDVDRFYDPDPNAPGKMTTRRGGFIDDVDLFDASFFGISPREAASMDPQQRLFLEVGWEALENAGIAPGSLNGSLTGVFAGISTSDYFQVHATADVDQIDAYSGTGGAFSVAAGRMSYALGLNGPNLPVDTACSSSLVAVHLASQSLRQRECNLALAGGVNLILSPAGTIYFSKLRAMARDGRCKTFDASADGYVRSEGCGFVVLERLSDAQANGRNILAVILGSAVNHDGRSGGLTAPSRFAQESVLRSAMRAADVKATEVDYVEAHGTGTPLGDPIEMSALVAAVGEGRDRDHPLLVGSVKTNIGHTEAAAGVAGLIKIILAIRKGRIPAHLNFRNPNPYVSWSEIPVSIPVNSVAWPQNEKRRIAGVSSFGFSGTNAHVVLAEAPMAPEGKAAGPERPRHVLPVSARNRTALLELAGRFVRHIAENPTASLADVCHTASTGRSHFGYRAAIVSSGDLDDLRESVLACAEGRDRANLFVSLSEQSGAPRVGFVFSSGGIADHDVDDLYRTQPAFRRAFDHCRELSKERLGVERNLSRFMVQYALAEMWKSWGVQPALVIGAGHGEFAAACAAGIVTVAEALEIMAGAEVRCGPGVVPFISAFSGDVMRLDKDGIPLHWRRAEIGGPCWAESIQSAKRLGCEVMIEIGSPRTGQACDFVLLPSLGSRGNWAVLAEAVARLYIQGVDIDWSGFDRDYLRKTVPLPTYTFQRQRHWLETTPEPVTSTKSAPEPIGDDLANWLYEVRWEEKPEAVSQIGPSTWIILADTLGGTARDLVEMLLSRGAESICVTRGKSYETGSPAWRIDPEVPEHFERVLSDAADFWGRPCTGVIWLWGTDDQPSDTTVDMSKRLSTAALHLVQALARAEGTAPTKLWLVTRGVHRVVSGDAASGLAQSVLWGFGRGVALEHSPLWGGLIDLGAGASSDAAAIIAEIGGRVEAECAIRKSRRYVPRLAQRKVDAGAPFHLRDDATYLITGGLGALGLQLGLWMTRSGARNLVFVGRRSASEAAQTALKELEALGARVRTVSADVSNPEHVRALFENAQEEFPPIRGIFHAAGVLEDGVILRQNAERFERVFAPKISGAWNLHTESASLNLDFFVLFSSAAAFFGSPGQSGYAAANAFLDALAWYRRGRGLPAISLNCGPWENLGMSLTRRPIPGVIGITPEKGMRVLELALSSAEPQLGMLPFDWDLFSRQFNTGRLPTLLGNIVRPEIPTTRESLREEPEILSTVQRAAAVERPEVITQYLKRRLHRIAGMSMEDISVSRDLLELGVDSLMAMELIQGIRQDLSLALYPREFYEHPSIASLSTYLANEIERLSTPSVSPAAAVVLESPKASRRDEPTVIDRIADIALLLSSPRSGSTLLRVMLAGHPGLFCPPELHLLPFATMGERESQLRSSYLDEGLQRAFMEAGNLDATASRTLTEDLVKRDVPIADVYRLLKEMAGARLLVDKSPTYANDMRTLRRAETLFAGAKYIHLIRHPVAMIESFVRNRMDKLAGQSGDPWSIAAQLWSAGNLNLLEFFKNVDASRQHRLQFEALVRAPEAVMKNLCTFIGVPFDDAVLRPYEGRRMTDGVHSKSLAIGDPNFLDHDHIEASKADVWRQQTLPASIQDRLEPAAAILGYVVAGSNGTSSKADAASAVRERFVDVRGRRICVCEWGDETAPPVVCLHGMLDHGAAWETVAVDLVNKGFRVIAPDLRGHGLSDHESLASSYHLLDFVADIDSILAGDTCTLVGHSLGAVIASLYSLARPERVGSLVLVEPPGLFGVQDRKRLEGLAAQLDQLVSPAEHPVFPDLPVVAARLQRSVPGMSAEQAARDARRLTRVCDGGLTWRWDPRLRARLIAGLDSLPAETYSNVVERFGDRVTFIYGSGGITADRREEMCGANDRRLTIAGGHNLHLESPAALAAAIVDACRLWKAVAALPGRQR